MPATIVPSALPKGRFAPLAAAALWSSLSPKTLRRIAKAGRLALYHVGRRTMVDLAELEALIRGGRAA